MIFVRGALIVLLANCFHAIQILIAVYTIFHQMTDCTITWNIFCILQESGAQGYDLVLVGHSLGAGTAAILAILLQQEYPRLHCYAYSPPGGLLR
jgi:hypothetical protein